MKTIWLAITLLSGCTVAINALAADSPKTPSSSTPPSTNQVDKAQARTGPQEAKTVVTGSYIKRTVHRNGMITDGSDPLLVLDEKSIKTSGASDLRQLLVQRGANR